MSRSGSNFTGTGENLGIFNVHPHRKPDSEDVEKPVDVSVKVGGLSVDAYDDKSSDASVSLTLMYHWRDPRLAQWEKGLPRFEPARHALCSGAWGMGQYIYIYIYVHIHINVHTYIQTCIHTYSHTYSKTNAQGMWVIWTCVWV